MKLVVLHFWLPLLDCIASANVVCWDRACDNKHSEMVFYYDRCMVIYSAPAYWGYVKKINLGSYYLQFCRLE